MTNLRAPRSFETTRWSLVRLAAGGEDTVARVALSGLCEAYWYPIYAYIRRAGHSPYDAEDFTQGFFAAMLRREGFAKAKPALGRFRTFLLACVSNYLHDERDRDQAQKRGPGLLVSFDGEWAEDRYGLEPVDDLTPDRIYQRRWAVTVLEHSLTVLREEFAATGEGALFDSLRPFLGFCATPEDRYAEVAAALHKPIGTVKSHIYRLRERWRDQLYRQVAMTLDDPTPEAIKAELAELRTGF